jgi:hypothetical protein
MYISAEVKLRAFLTSPLGGVEQVVYYLGKFYFLTQKLMFIFLQLNIPWSYLYSCWKQNDMTQYWT